MLAYEHEWISKRMEAKASKLKLESRSIQWSKIYCSPYVSMHNSDFTQNIHTKYNLLYFCIFLDMHASVKTLPLPHRWWWWWSFVVVEVENVSITTYQNSHMCLLHNVAVYYYYFIFFTNIFSCTVCVCVSVDVHTYM